MKLDLCLLTRGLKILCELFGLFHSIASDQNPSRYVKKLLPTPPEHHQRRRRTSHSVHHLDFTERKPTACCSTHQSLRPSDGKIPGLRPRRHNNATRPQHFTPSPPTNLPTTTTAAAAAGRLRPPTACRSRVKQSRSHTSGAEGASAPLFKRRPCDSAGCRAECINPASPHHRLTHAHAQTHGSEHHVCLCLTKTNKIYMETSEQCLLILP